MAKTPARTPRAGKKYVKTGEATVVMQQLLDDLKEAKSGETGWGMAEALKVEHAILLLGLALSKIKCPPSQSFPLSGAGPGPALRAARRRSK